MKKIAKESGCTEILEKKRIRINKGETKWWWLVIQGKIKNWNWIDSDREINEFPTLGGVNMWKNIVRNRNQRQIFLRYKWNL